MTLLVAIVTPNNNLDWVLETSCQFSILIVFSSLHIATLQSTDTPLCQQALGHGFVVYPLQGILKIILVMFGLPD